MKRFFLMTTVAVSMLIFLNSCIDNGDGTNPQQGAFLIVNASPDAPALNVKLNSSNFGNGLSYGIYTPYYGKPAGPYTFAFADSTNTTKLTSTENIEANKYYSYFVIDSFKRLKAAFVPDRLATTSGDSAFIRFFNFSPNAGVVSLRDSASATDWFTNRSFNDQGSGSNSDSVRTSFTKVLKGIYTFQLRRSDGTILASRKDTLSGGSTYTAFAKGNVGGTGAQIISIGQVENYRPQ